MPFSPASSPKSLEEELRQYWTEVSTRKNLTISCARGAVMESATMNSPSGNEASPGSHRQRGFKSLTPRDSIEKMRPRRGAIDKHQRQHRQTSKGPVKIFPADASNFKDLVYEHTSMHASSPMLDVAAQPSSPLTPHSTSNSCIWGVRSQPSSPATPHSIQSSTTSPLMSPQSDYPKNGTNVNSLQLPSAAQAELSSFLNTHLSVPCTPPHKSALALSHNTNRLHQSNGMSTQPYASPFPWESIPNMSSSEKNLSMSPRSYEKQLSLERLILNDAYMPRLWPDGENLP